jgi:O-antigen/teichoic acid export membrane protein
LPVQWRFALSWWSGYFLTYFFTPILFRYYGPVVAGQMGMTWSVVSTIGALSTAWISTRAARFGMLVARREYKELDRMAVRSGMACVGVAALGAVGLESLVLAMHAIGFPLVNRILSPLPTGLFLAGQVLMQVAVVQGVYLRAHKREPLAALSATAALLVVGTTCYFGKIYGAVGAAASYCGVTLLVLPGVTAILIRCRRLWHEGPQ